MIDLFIAGLVIAAAAAVEAVKVAGYLHRNTFALYSFKFGFSADLTQTLYPFKFTVVLRK